jgi:hypothetical protein
VFILLPFETESNNNNNIASEKKIKKKKSSLKKLIKLIILTWPAINYLFFFFVNEMKHKMPKINTMTGVYFTLMFK